VLRLYFTKHSLIGDWDWELFKFNSSMDVTIEAWPNRVGPAASVANIDVG